MHQRNETKVNQASINYESNSSSSQTQDRNVSVSYTKQKLQHEYKHAPDFGIEGNWNKSNSEAYQNAIQNHINTASEVYQSVYRGDPVTVYINSKNSLGAYVDLDGNYVGGWKFNTSQIDYHRTNGTRIE